VYDGRLSGKEHPSRPGAVFLGERFQHSGRIVFGIDSDRIHEQIPADSIAKQPLNRGEVCADREESFVLDGHKVDHDHLAPKQIVVKQCPLALMRIHEDVGEIMGIRPVMWLRTVAGSRILRRAVRCVI
jgi:hypothetical protein